MKKNPYFIDEPARISFSGGRTSAYMLWKVLEAHGGVLPNHVVVTFANTGKELPETLDFVHACSVNWDVPIVWLERYSAKELEGSKNKVRYKTTVVDYFSAARNGEPFNSLIKARGYAPNPVARFCTKELKTEAMKHYIRDHHDFPKPYLTLIGIRADEDRRAKKLNGVIEAGEENYLPLYVDGVTKEDIYSFWTSQNFDLNLPNNNGTTDWGNCDLCFLKGFSKKLSIIEARPDLSDWWIDQEKSLSKNVGKLGFFRTDHPSYEQLKVIASDQGSLFGFDNESIPCFCGD